MSQARPERAKHGQFGHGTKPTPREIVTPITEISEGAVFGNLWLVVLLAAVALSCLIESVRDIRRDRRRERRRS